MGTKKQGILGLRRKKFTFSRAQKHLIVQEYLTGILSKREIWEKYTGEKEEHGQILRWMREFGYDNQTTLDNNTTFVEIVTDMGNKTKSNAINKATTETIENTEILQRRIALLEYQLKEEQAKAAAFSTMIDIAEKELKISIRKK